MKASEFAKTITDEDVSNCFADNDIISFCIKCHDGVIRNFRSDINIPVSNIKSNLATFISDGDSK